MKHVDALSRHPMMTIMGQSISEQIKIQQKQDHEIKALIEIARDKTYDNYQLNNGVLYKFQDGRDLFIIPNSLETDIIHSIHEKGHYAAKRTEEIISQECYIRDLNHKIEKYIASCVPYILSNRKKDKREGYLHPLPKPDTPLHTYHADHSGSLETTSQNYIRCTNKFPPFDQRLRH